MNVKVSEFHKVQSKSMPNVRLRCPACGDKGTFDELGEMDGLNSIGQIFGSRRCPNAACQCLIFFVWHNGRLVATYPQARIDFDKNGIPQRVLSAFEEAITCHAHQAFAAAAIMIRKTLEEICLDKSAVGKNLKERIKDLGSKIVVPKELMDGMDDLRLLGNDAAHIESQEFNKVSQEEVEIGLEFAKEILKAVYQYEHLLKRIRSLKVPSTPPNTP